MSPQTIPTSIAALVSVLFLILAALAACQPIVAPTKQANEIDVPFETVVLNEGEVGIDLNKVSPEPQLLLLTSPDELVMIADNVNSDTLAALQQIDFQRFSVIVLLRGRKPSYNYQTVIERITKRGNQLVVYSQFWEPNPVYPVAAAETSPYHLVTVDKQMAPVESIELVLQAHSRTPTPPAR